MWHIWQDIGAFGANPQLFLAPQTLLTYHPRPDGAAVAAAMFYSLVAGGDGRVRHMYGRLDIKLVPADISEHLKGGGVARWEAGRYAQVGRERGMSMGKRALIVPLELSAFPMGLDL